MSYNDIFNPLEIKAEDKFFNHVSKDGNECIKMNLRGRRGWPDRLVVLDYGYCFFIEFKRIGEGLRPLQKYIHKMLKKKGHTVYTVDNFIDAVAIYETEKRKLNKRVKKNK